MTENHEVVCETNQEKIQHMVEKITELFSTFEDEDVVQSYGFIICTSSKTEDGMLITHIDLDATTFDESNQSCPADAIAYFLDVSSSAAIEKLNRKDLK